MSDTEAPLLPKGKQDAIDELLKEPVGGHPGNGMFKVYLQLSIRGTVWSVILGAIVWLNAGKLIGIGHLQAYVPLAICIFLFTINPIFGTVVCNAWAGIIGTFLACFNIFMLRGFFPDGVLPTDPEFSGAAIVGFADLVIFNLIFLACDCAMGTRMFAMASNTGFMLQFLNPLDETRYSKNFQIDPKGTAVSSFIGVSLGSVAAILCMLIPFPWQFAYNDMKANALRATQDTAKCFIKSVRYFRGASANVLMDYNMAEVATLRKELDGMGGSINSAWWEGFDVGTRGTVRALIGEHAGVLNKIFDILHSLQIALSTEDFGPSHLECMGKIGPSCQVLVEQTGLLLLDCTHAAGDGDISSSDKDNLQAGVAEVKAAMKDVATSFDAARRSYNPVCKELLSESFFVFAISAYARFVIEYADLLCSTPPQGLPVVGSIIAGFKSTFTPSAEHHDRFILRYWAALTTSFIFGVTMDGYGGSCAIMAVFLLNTRVGPDMMATLNTLLAVVVGVVVGAVIFSYSCMAYDGPHLLILMSSLYWLLTIFVGYSGSSFALVGIFMAALAPFMLVQNCPDPSKLDPAAAAAGLWVAIRGTIISMVIVSIFEFGSVPGEQAKLAVENLDRAFKKVEHAFEAMFSNTDPSADIAAVPGFLGTAGTFSAGAILEPRFSKCTWKSGFMTEVIAVVTKLRLDVLTMRHAIEGADGQADGTFGVLTSVPEFQVMAHDLMKTLEDAREISTGLLDHKTGIWHGMSRLDSVEGIDELDGMDQAIMDLNKAAGVKFPSAPPDSMEDDLLCQLSIVFVMLEYTVKHIGEIIKITIKKQF